jgi:hypothetical protein
MYDVRFYLRSRFSICFVCIRGIRETLRSRANCHFALTFAESASIAQHSKRQLPQLRHHNIDKSLFC